MRMGWVVLGLAIGAGTCMAGQVPDGAPAQDAKIEAARAIEAARIARKAAESYTMTTGKTVLKLEPKSLLQWSNPVSGSFHGSVFLWTDRGRPEVVASIYRWYSRTPHLGVELHSLASGPVRAEREGRIEWSTDRPGVAFRPIPDAPEPADSPDRRMRQMRDLARQFIAEETDRNNVSRGLRLLSQPLYRYPATHPYVIDGALFTFAEATDTEILLMLEARRGKDGPAWHYALARMNSVSLRVFHSRREVWSVPTLPWEQVFDARQPYALFTFQPGQGVNPPDPNPGP